MAAKGAVAAGHPVTAQAAADILKEGGNAFDAALAGVLAACVAEPVLASLGGGGFCLTAREGGAPLVYDFFAQTPMSRPADIDFFPIIADFGTAQQEFHIGMGAIATPGVVRGAFAIHRDLGSMPFADIAAPAIAAARGGVTVNALQAYIFRIVQSIYLSNESCRAQYGSPTDQNVPLGEGDRFALPDFADVLEVLAREGEDLFYRGEIAARVAVDCAARGGCLNRADFESYQVVRRQPLVCRYDDAQISINPPPSTGGLLIAFALRLLQDRKFAGGGFGSVAHLDHLIRAMAATNLARSEGALHEKSEADMAAHYLDDAFVTRYRALVDKHPPSYRGTTHISVIDRAGNVAALTLSNGEGAAYIAPGTGIMLNNMLGEEDINPHGYNCWPQDVRMSSMMAPMLMRDQNGGLTALGSGGSNRIRTALLQTILNLTSFGLPLEDAIETPRLHVEGDTLSIEDGFTADVLDQLSLPDGLTPKLWPDRNFFFGGVHGVRLHDDGRFEAAGDPRRGGAGEIVR